MDEYSKTSSWGRRVQFCFWTANRCLLVNIFTVIQTERVFRDEDLFLSKISTDSDLWPWSYSTVSRNFIVDHPGRGVVSASIVRHTQHIRYSWGKEENLASSRIRYIILYFVATSSVLDICIAPITNSIIAKALARCSDDTGSVSIAVVCVLCNHI